MKKIIFSVAMLIFLISCGNKNEEKLIFYAGVEEDHALLVATEFEKETGIKTEFVRMSNGEILARLKAEKNNMVASVWYGGPVDGMIAANEAGLLEKYVSPLANEIPEKFRDKDGMWTGIYTNYLGFISNKKLLQEKGLEAPTSWNDLLNEKLKNEIVMAHPGASGTAYAVLATLVQMYGEENAINYLKELNGQIRQYTKSGSAPARMAGSSEIAVGIGFLGQGLKYIYEGYNDIVLSVPKEGTGYELGAVSLLKNAPNQEAAKKFIDFVISKKGQELGQQVGSFQLLTNVNANNPKEASPFVNTKLIDYDFVWAGKNRKELIEKFNTKINDNVPQK